MLDHGEGRTERNLLQIRNGGESLAGGESLGWRQMLTGELFDLLGGDVQYQKARREKNSNGIV
jgi:hypothetical protein